MIIDNNPQPKSSFLSMEKDMRLITNMFLKFFLSFFRLFF